MGANHPSSSSAVSIDIADESGLSGNRQNYPRSNSQNNQVKNYAIAMAGEFLGTFFFLFCAFTAVQAAKITDAKDGGKYSSPVALLNYIALSFGLSLTVSVWLFFRVSGGLFNPAITLGVMLVGAMPLGKGALLIVSQILGSIVAAVVAHELTPGVTPGGVLAVQTSLAPGVSLVQGVFIECLVTCLLTLTVMMIAVEKHRATFMAPLVIGVALTIGHMISVNLTGAGMNPVRSFGPAVASGTFVPEHWIYWVGPCLGGALAAAIYKGLLVVEYTSANPGQDDDGIERENRIRNTTYMDGGSGSGR